MSDCATCGGGFAYRGGYSKPRATKNIEPCINTLQELKDLHAQIKSLVYTHNIQAELPDECLLILSQSFADYYWEADTLSPEYSEWFHSRKPIHAYNSHRDILKLIGMEQKPTQRELVILITGKTPIFIPMIILLFRKK